jgi:hypothetical protein
MLHTLSFGATTVTVDDTALTVSINGGTPTPVDQTWIDGTLNTPAEQARSAGLTATQVAAGQASASLTSALDTMRLYVANTAPTAAATTAAYTATMTALEAFRDLPDDARTHDMRDLAIQVQARCIEALFGMLPKP